MNIFEVLLNYESPSSSPFLEGILAAQNYWVVMKSILDKLFEENTFDKSKTTEVWLQINQNAPSLVNITISYYLDELNQKLSNSYQKEFFSVLSEDKSNIQGTIQAFQYLNSVFKLHKSFINVLELHDNATVARDSNIESYMLFETAIDKFKLAILKTNEFGIMLKDLYNYQYELFKSYLISAKYSQLNDNLDLGFINYSEQTFGEDQYDNELLLSITDIVYQFHSFEIIPEILYNFITQRLISCVDNHENNAETPIPTPYLTKLLDYFNRFIRPFFETIYSRVLSLETKQKTLLDEVLKRILYFIYETYAERMIKRIFDIILDAEDININIIREIREAVELSNMMNMLATTLTKQLKSRLLIPGVITQSIINYFINTVKILQLIDPAGIIYDIVTNPIKTYLLHRPDALRGIINILTEDSDSYTRLGQESITIPTGEINENAHDASSDEDEKTAETWQVLSFQNRISSKSSIKYKVSDMVTWLVNLYGSQEAFINEYQNMLGEKLVGGKPYNFAEEIKNLELLKVKFGDDNLQNCEIMRRDIKNSKSINNNIHQTYDKEFDSMDIEVIKKKPTNVNPGPEKNFLKFEKLNAIFLSKGYWPINYDYDSFKMPPNLQTVFDQYSAKYSMTKFDRKLIWHHSLGWVDLDLEFDNGSFNFKCLPTHAIVISYFDEKYLSTTKTGTISLDFLANEIGMPPNQVRQLMSFWVHRGVVQEKKNNPTNIRKSISALGYFTVNEQQDLSTLCYAPVNIYEGTQAENWDIYDDIENELIKGGQLSGDATQSNSTIENLIVGMLKTNGPKTGEKIHQLLKTVYKADIPYNYTENQTKEILRKMLTKQSISFNGEVYSSKI